MGRMRHSSATVLLAAGEEARVADPPSTDPLKNLNVSVVPGNMGAAIPAGVGLVCTMYYGGGHGQSPVAYGPNYNTGVQKATVTLLPASLIPQKVFTDSGICPPDRWRDGTTVRVDAHLARALHLYNNTGSPMQVRVMFASEELNEAT